MYSILDPSDRWVVCAHAARAPTGSVHIGGSYLVRQIIHPRLVAIGEFRVAERRQALTEPRNIEDTRHILRELLAAPLRFTPILEEGRRGYRFNSALSLAGIFGSELAVRSVASPGGSVVLLPPIEVMVPRSAA